MIHLPKEEPLPHLSAFAFVKSRAIFEAATISPFSFLSAKR
jgi:hypothetical protein